MTTPIRDKPLAEILFTLLQKQLADVHVSLPGQVTRVDNTTGLVDVKPLLKAWDLDNTGARVAISVPVLIGVPIVWPGGGGFRVTFPLAVNDIVLLVFADRNLDTWKTMGGEVDPLSETAHALSDAIAIPGLRSFNAPWTGVDPASVTVGQDGGSFQGAGLGPALRTELDAIWNAIYGGHTHPVPGITPGGGATTSSPAVGVPSKQTVTSATVKVST